MCLTRKKFGLHSHPARPHFPRVPGPVKTGEPAGSHDPGGGFRSQTTRGDICFFGYFDKPQQAQWLKAPGILHHISRSWNFRVSVSKPCFPPKAPGEEPSCPVPTLPCHSGLLAASLECLLLPPPVCFAGSRNGFLGISSRGHHGT